MLETTFKQCLACARTGKTDNCFEKLHEDVRMFAARLVLYCGVTESGRLDILRSLGFDMQASIQGVTFHQMTLVFLALLSATVMGLLFFTGNSAESVDARLRKGLMIALIYIAAVGSAVYTSKRTSVTPDYEWATYLLASFISVVVAGFLAFGFGVITFGGDIGAAAINIRLRYPYLFTAGVTCFVTCVMLDTKANAWLTLRRLRLIESLVGVLLGLALAMGVWVVLTLQSEYLAKHKPMLAGLLTVPPLKALGFIFLALNTSIAALIPHWFRRAAKS
jgi:hypothetical protein